MASTRSLHIDKQYPQMVTYASSCSLGRVDDNA